MKCFIDAKVGTVKDAVAVCAVCGMGLCLDHLTERRMPQAASTGEAGTTGQMLVLCERCAAAVTS